MPNDNSEHWFDRQLRIATEATDKWPEWMRREAGLKPKELAKDVGSRIGCLIDDEKVIQEAIEAAVRDAEPRWIPVTERLPKQYIQVIAYDSLYKQMGTARRYDSKLEFDGLNDDCDITHWIPLPEPPKENEDGNTA